MGYNAIRGRRPMERASKLGQTQIISNQAVQAFLAGCLPLDPPSPHDVHQHVVAIPAVQRSRVRAVVAIDGGMNEASVRKEFPSASIVFMTFGPLMFRLEDLSELDRASFIGPEDIAKLKQLERYTAVVPAKLIRRADSSTFSAGVRKTIHEVLEADGARLGRALAWLLFREWRPPSERSDWSIPRCPSCGETGPRFVSEGPTVLRCVRCDAEVYLADSLRLYERIDDDLGAGGIMSYLLTTLEHLTLVYLIRVIWELKASMLSEVLFIKDGPLAFFGTTAPLRSPMLDLMQFLGQQRGGPCIFLAGVEKSGAFVEHAAQIEQHLRPFEALVLNNEYIRKYIVPGDPGTQPYGENMYYGSKVIVKGAENDMYVVTLPVGEYKRDPSLSDLFNSAEVLRTVIRLRCSMYDNALVPVALVNRLVSLADVPTTDILAKFARERLGGGL